MLSIQSQTSISKCTPNILPCRINHNGPVNAEKRYWNPEDDADGKKTAYFRGRKLHGRTVKVPEAYKGVVLQSTDRMLPVSTESCNRVTSNLQTNRVDDHDIGASEDEEEPDPVKILEEVAAFEEVVVWGHEMVPGKDDIFVRGLEEWIGFAEAMHSTRGRKIDANASREG